VISIKGMLGMGDCIYQRAFVRELAGDVYLSTPWPQLYQDLPNIFPVECSTRLRTQGKNIVSQPLDVWHETPEGARRMRIGYGDRPILKSFSDRLGVEAKIFDLPKFERLPIETPYAIIRPVTVRSEWKNVSRNPLDTYVCKAAEILRACGFKTISVADLRPEEEWCDELPRCDLNFNGGELSFDKLMGLVRGAALVVGGIGWIVPAAIAANVPLISILGGNGFLNAPEKITGAPMNLSRAKFIFPDNYCRCKAASHSCDKVISNFEKKFIDTLEGLCLNRYQPKN